MTHPLSTPRPELLAPAGGPEALRAAVSNGADAVYLGIDEFNARRGAANFTMESLAEATSFAHLRDSKVYLTANVVILEHEMNQALGMVADAWSAGVDAVIVQDLGLARLVRSELPHVRLHASTQIDTHNSLTIAELGRLGFARVTLARETSIDEIASMVAESPIEVESFVHGALCVSYSGQCLMSSMIGGRSANRGLCAQPCRLAYDLFDEHGKKRADVGAHLLSPKDLGGIDSLGRLVRTGVAALKIEGRMKSPEYVALVTGVFRAALDRAIEDPDGFEATDAEHSILAEAFSRGFSSAYLDDIRDNSMMSYTRPNNRGVQVGRVSRVNDREVTVALDVPVDPDDTVEYWTSRGRFAQKVGEMRLRGERTAFGPAGESVTVRTDRPVAAGDRVFRVVNARLEQAARRTFADESGVPSIPVSLSVRVAVGRPLRIEAAAKGASVFAEGPVVEKARTKAVSAEEIVEHVGRVGGTAFEIAGWDIELDPGAGVGFSVLHRVRRDALDRLTATLLEPWDRPAVHAPRVSAPRPRVAPTDVPEIVVHSSDLRVVRACLGAGAQHAIVPAWALLLADDVPERVSVELPRVAHDRETTDLVRAAGVRGRATVGNLGLLRAAAETGAQVDAHWGLNVTNPWTAEALAEMGASFVWVSPELSGRQTHALTRSSAVPVGLAVYGRQELMVTEHCVLMSMGPCNQLCGVCRRREGWFALRDAKGYSFPVMTDPTGRSHVFNSVPLDLSRALPEIMAAGVAAVRLDFTVETIQVAQKVTRYVREAIAAIASGKASGDHALAENATTGHFYRGVK